MLRVAIKLMVLIDADLIAIIKRMVNLGVDLIADIKLTGSLDVINLRLRTVLQTIVVIKRTVSITAAYIAGIRPMVDSIVEKIVAIRLTVNLDVNRDYIYTKILP